ncbi:MAG: hypothetical protein H2015_00620, partial [Chloroflexi bacterium]|nr:hypothetical protein [Chloroflexota bacterium]
MSEINNENMTDEQSVFNVPKIENSIDNSDGINENNEYETDLTQDSVKTYLSEIGKNDLLKQEEEKFLAMQLEASEDMNIKLGESISEISITQANEWFNNSKSIFLESKNSLSELINFNKLSINAFKLKLSEIVANDSLSSLI